MVFDDVIIGSGLSALGTVMGLDRERRVLVLAGAAAGAFAYYDARRVVPCAYQGLGGLGNNWHGVIPLGLRSNFGGATQAGFAQYLAEFYPHTKLDASLPQSRLFVPWRPIRPARELARLQSQSAGHLSLRTQAAAKFHWQDAGITVRTADGSQYQSRRLWIAAGVLHTPQLLEQSLGRSCARNLVSDHVLSYAGQLRGQPAPKVTRTRDGLLFPAHYPATGQSLYTLRPARFAFRKLDFGIEQRVVFGMPTGNAVARIMRRMSPGLLAEALYNRAGLFPSAEIQSLYAQTPVPDAYVLGSGALPLQVRMDAIAGAMTRAREQAPFDGLLQSRRHEFYIPGIHLHHSVHVPAVQALGINQPDSPIQIVDASVIEDIGPEHHSFKLMLLARDRARGSGATGSPPRAAVLTRGVPPEADSQRSVE